LIPESSSWLGGPRVVVEEVRYIGAVARRGEDLDLDGERGKLEKLRSISFRERGLRVRVKVFII